MADAKISALTALTGANLATDDMFPVVDLSATTAGSKKMTTAELVIGLSAQGLVTGPASATDNAIARFDGTTGKIVQNSAVTVADTTGAMALLSDSATIALGASSDVILARDAAGKMALRNGTNAQTFAVCNTYSSGGTNYEEIRLEWYASAAYLNVAYGGTGAARSLNINVGGGTKIGVESSLVTFYSAVSVANVNIQTSTTTGTKIGTATTQKLGFFNSTPIVQPSGTGETAGFTAGAGTAVTDQSTFTGNVGSTAYRISDVVKALKNLGFLAS